IVRHILFGKQEIGKVERELKELMSLLDFQLDSMPGIDLVTASALIAEIGDVRRFPNANKLARFAGIAPVYFGSGGKGK
ncbi:transposase, partial [Escherichia coli]|nr:transposase [Escherichia coli]